MSAALFEKLATSSFTKFFLFALLTYLGTHFFSLIDTRRTESGDKLHPSFRILLVGADKKFFLSTLDALPVALASHPGAVLNMPDASGTFTDGAGTSISYEARSDDGKSQYVEVTERDDDMTTWSYYRVTGDTVAPIKSRIFHVAYMFRAALSSFVIVILYGLLTRFVLKRKGSGK